MYLYIIIQILVYAESDDHEALEFAKMQIPVFMGRTVSRPKLIIIIIILFSPCTNSTPTSTSLSATYIQKE